MLDTARRSSGHYYPFTLFLAEVGCRFSEAAELRRSSLDLGASVAQLVRTKTGGQKTNVALSKRLVGLLRGSLAHIAPPSSRVFVTPCGADINYSNFLRRVWNPLVREALPGRRFTPHGLRHTWATLHLANGSPIKWIQEHGGWTSAKMLLDRYGHYLPTEQRGFEEALTPSKPELTGTATEAS